MSLPPRTSGRGGPDRRGSTVITRPWQHAAPRRPWLPGTRAPTGPGSVARYDPPHWRIRLVAYGARLESGLGATPREFESPILRREQPRFAGTSVPYGRRAARPARRRPRRSTSRRAAPPPRWTTAPGRRPTVPSGRSSSPRATWTGRDRPPRRARGTRRPGPWGRGA